MNDKYVSVSDFYAGKSVFITGGGGFLGKVIVEKLLYSCPGINKIYMLLRDKRGLTAELRLQNVTELPIFDRLKAVRPDDLKKLHVIKGDVRLPDYGMSDADLRTVINEVNIVIHSAASIKFNDTLETSLSINYKGAENLLNLMHKIKNIQVFVHISTAYTNSDKPVSEEIVYPPPARIEDAYEFAKTHKMNGLDNMEKFLNGRPNTYVFTKALIENLIAEKHGNIPTIIVRPSTVSASYNEPLEGWVDSWFGSTGMIMNIATGLCRVVLTSDDIIMDLIPVDYVSNLTIVAAAKAKKSSNVEVFNACTGDSNPLTMQRFSETFIEFSKNDKLYLLPYPNLFVRTRSRWLVYLITTLCYICAYIYDAWTFINWKKPRLVKRITQAALVTKALEYFTSHTWVMRTNRTEDLSDSLTHEDARIFPFNPKHINWDDYLFIYYNGVKKFLIK